MKVPVRALEACSSMMTCEVLDMDYFGPLLDKGAEAGVNAFTLFILPDSYYPETSPAKHWEFESGLDWPSMAYPRYRNPHCPNATEETEYVPQLIDRCHQLGMKFYLRTINNKHHWLFPEHDDWKAVERIETGGTRIQEACCWDIPHFMEYYSTLLRELLERYPETDGIILDQQKNFGPYVNPEVAAPFRELMGKDMSLASMQDLRDYWSIRNARRVRDTVAFCRDIIPDLEVGVTLEGALPQHMDCGQNGLKYEFFNLATTGVDFIHHQIIKKSDEDCFGVWERLTCDGPIWIMMDPLAVDAPWPEQATRFWGWQPRTPETIAADLDKIERVAARLSHPENIVGIAQFPVSGLPLDHPNLAAVLQQMLKLSH